MELVSRISSFAWKGPTVVHQLPNFRLLRSQFQLVVTVLKPDAQPPVGATPNEESVLKDMFRRRLEPVVEAHMEAADAPS